MSANAHIAKRAQESSIDALVDKFSTVLDTSLILAIANEPGPVSYTHLTLPTKA